MTSHFTKKWLKIKELRDSKIIFIEDFAPVTNGEITAMYVPQLNFARFETLTNVGDHTIFFILKIFHQARISYEHVNNACCFIRFLDLDV